MKEIERKWLVTGWPEDYVPEEESAPRLLEIQSMRQGYVSVEPTVRIREESFLYLRPEDGSQPAISSVPLSGKISTSLPSKVMPAAQANALDTSYILCFKSSGGIAREEIEFPIEKDQFAQLESLIGLPLIPKIRRTYRLSDGQHLEVNQVDADSDTAFWYAEIEFPSIEKARGWSPDTPWLSAYLHEEVTEIPGYSMGSYWLRTRKANKP